MHLPKFLHILPLVATTTGAGHLRRDDDVQLDGQYTKQYIVEVENESEVDALSERLTKGKSARIIKTYKSDVFAGLAIETEEDNVDSLGEIAGVTHAWISSIIDLPDPIDGDDAVLASLSDNYSEMLHSWSGVSHAHAEGNFGQGITVAVIDTGIDYNHEALGGGFGPGYKVIGGWDFVGDDWVPPSTNLNPGNDPIDIRGHGTSCAGIIAGQNEFYTGVAPEVSILAYKVFGRSGGSDEVILIDALIRAYEDGADVVSISIGGHNGWAHNPWAVVASRVADKGVIVVNSGGNSGDSGPFFGSSGASGQSVLAVAASQPDTLLAEAAFGLVLQDDNGESTEERIAITFNADRRWTYDDIEIVPLSLNTTWERQGCSRAETPDDLGDMTDKIILVRRGGCAYNSMVGTVNEIYAPRGIMFYNPDGFRPDRPFTAMTQRDISLVDFDVGVAIINTIAAGGVAKGKFAEYLNQNWYIGIHNRAGGRPSAFTSWGGLFDLQQKPDVAAPGSDIFMPTVDDGTNNGWRTGSGTSMAAPYIAGIAALFLSQRGGGRAVHGEGISREFFNRVVSSGNVLAWSTRDVPEPVDTGFWAPPIQAGSGNADAFKVLTYTTKLDTVKLALNDTANFKGVQTVRIFNGADEDVEYTFQLQPAAGVYIGAVGTNHVVRLGDTAPTEMIPGFQAPSGSFVVPAGEARTAEFLFQYPTGLDTSRQPVYSGKILITSSADEILSVTYMGAAYDLREHYERIFSGVPFIRSQNVPIENKNEVTFDAASDDHLRALFLFAWGCDELRWDIYETDWTESQWEYPPVIGEAGYIGSATTWARSSVENFNPDRHDPQDTIAFPLGTFGRDLAPVRFGVTLGYHRVDWFGKLANGTQLAPGRYKMRFAALRPFGRPEFSADWDVHETPEFVVLAQ